MAIKDKIVIKAKKVFSPIFNEEIIAFSSIANPSLFKKALEENGAIIKKFYEYPDHYLYSRHELDYIFKDNQHSKIVTTFKDYVKLEAKHQKIAIILEEKLILETPGTLLDEIIAKKN